LFEARNPGQPYGVSGVGEVPLTPARVLEAIQSGQG
jgi:hypothetical protein